MPVAPTYPGVYIEEVPSGVRTITGVATSITAFIGRAKRGPTNEPTTIQSFAAYERVFGGLDSDSLMSQAISQFFNNGGTDALVVRIVANDAAKASIKRDSATGTTNDFQVTGVSEGAWGNKLRLRVDHLTREPRGSETATELFNLFVKDTATGTVEDHRNVSFKPEHPRFVGNVLEDESNLIRFVDKTLAGRPKSHVSVKPTIDPFQDPPKPGDPPNADLPADRFSETDGLGNDGGTPSQATDLLGGPNAESEKKGLFALEKADLFNLLCIPPLGRDAEEEISNDTYAIALKYCLERRAMLIVDSPSSWNSISKAELGVNAMRSLLGGVNNGKNAAVFFPRLKMADPLQENRTAEFVPCGAVAGIMAKTDAQRGIWKAPAGIEAGIAGVREFSVKMTDPENGRLNPLGVNCLRNFPVYGNLIWGSRTLAGADQLASEWKYIPVRRLTLFMEESLYRGTTWVVFEPNDEPLWSQIRLNVGAFMQNLFRQGAFQGRTAREAYFVRCDKTTTTQNDINLGIVNIEVGFAPLKPAEFVIIKIQQIAGDIDT